MERKAIVAAVVAGLAATLIDNAAAAVVFGADFLALTTERPGRFAVAVGGALLIPLILRAVGPPLGFLAAFAALAIGAAALAKTVFGYAAPWTNVLLLTSIYAVAAIAIFAALRPKPS